MVRIRGSECLFSGKFSIRAKWMALSWCYVSGQTLGSTHVNSVSKDHRKPPLQTSSIKDVNVKRRLAADETVFRIYKGVKTFDLSKIKNIMATGGLLIVYGVLVFWTFLWYFIFVRLNTWLKHSKIYFLFRYGPFNTPVESLCTGVYSRTKIKALV